MSKLAMQVIPNRWKEVEDAAGNRAWADAGRIPTTESVRSRFKGNGAHAVRRPTRGVQIKQETFASLRVLAGDHTPKTLIDAGSRKKDMKTDGGLQGNDTYSNFLLQAVSEDRMEKQQILETFGEAFIFLFGQRARVITFQGILLNTFDFNWEAEWWENYDRYLRGTKCVENDARVFISFDETLVGGYILSCGSQKNAQERNHVPFTFQLFVTSYSNFSQLGDPSADPNIGNLGSLTADGVTGPKRLLSGTALTGKVGSDGKVEDPGFFESISTVNAIQSFNKYQGYASEVLDRVKDTYENGIVLTPKGLIGAYQWVTKDSGPEKVRVGQSGAIKYTTFAENTDEYVTPGSQYAPSSVVINEINKVGYQIDGKLIRNLKEIWQNKGFKAPENGTIGVGFALNAQQPGSTLVGSASGWAVPAIAGVAGAALVGSIVAGALTSDDPFTAEGR